MSAPAHRASTRAGMLASSERIGARRRYARGLAIIRHYGARAVQMMLRGTPAQIELLSADIAHGMPLGRERDAVLHMLRYASAFCRFRKRNPDWVAGQVFPLMDRGAE